MNANDQFVRDLTSAVNAHFGHDHIASAHALINRRAKELQGGRSFSTNLTRAAYRKGLIAGLSIDSLSPAPVCPYEKERPLANYMRGDNDPIRAWNTGRSDGERIQAMLLRPDRDVSPTLLMAEYRLLPPDVQREHDARIDRVRKVG